MVSAGSDGGGSVSGGAAMARLETAALPSGGTFANYVLRADQVPIDLTVALPADDWPTASRRPIGRNSVPQKNVHTGSCNLRVLPSAVATSKLLKPDRASWTSRRRVLPEP